MERSRHQQLKEKAEVITSEWIYQGRIIALRSDYFEGPPYKRWDIVVHPGAVVILPLLNEHTMILVKQWRRSTERILIEFPAGTLEEGENPMTSAQRELQEETGYRADSLTALGGFYSTPGFCNEYLHLFLAHNLQNCPLPPDDGEEIDLIFASPQEVILMIKNHTIVDAKTIAAMFYYTQHESIDLFRN